MAKKQQPIKYTSRDFDSIRRDLENYAKRYYPDTYQDFNEASFGSLMLDTVSYVGDILSFYLDYQVNESFLDSANEYGNVIRLARQMGFKLNSSPSSYGVLSFYIEVPASTDSEGPDLAYAPVLEAGSQFGSSGGGMYTLLADVDFAQPANHVVVGTISGEIPSSYIIRGQGRVVSGRSSREYREAGPFRRFKKILLSSNTVAEILSVVDSDGHEYFEVDNLSQNIIYKAIRNNNIDKNTAPSILKAIPVARRFVVERTANRTYLQFGYGSDSELLSSAIAEPSNVVLNLHGRSYITEPDFDPTKLISTDKFGIAPANTNLTISYRVNTTRDVNAATDTVVNILKPSIKFTNAASLNAGKRSTVVASLECTNAAPITGDISLPSATEVRQRVISHFAAQNRAVTAEDYKTMVYGMPTEFGAIKRCAVVRDFSEFKRNINVYLISENTQTGKLVPTNSTIKINLKTWIDNHRMINDTVDLLDASVVNYAVKYLAVADYNTNRFTVLSRANSALTRALGVTRDIGEPIYISDVFKTLQDVEGIIDVVSVTVEGRSGGIYSEVEYDFDQHMSNDGRFISADSNIVFELKYPNVDIVGSIT